MPIQIWRNGLKEDEQEQKQKKVNAINPSAPAPSAAQNNQYSPTVRPVSIEAPEAGKAPTQNPQGSAATTYDPAGQAVTGQPAPVQEPQYKVNEKSPWATMATMTLNEDKPGLEMQFSRLSTRGDALYTPNITATNVDALGDFSQSAKALVNLYGIEGVDLDFSKGMSRETYDFFYDFFLTTKDANGNEVFATTSTGYESPNTTYGRSKDVKTTPAYLAQKAAFDFNKVISSEKGTREAEDALEKVKGQIEYWAVERADLNLSDAEIIDRLDLSSSEYKALRDMAANAVAGTPSKMNRGVAYSENLLEGYIWQARNKDISSGNPVYDSISSAMGVGNIWHYDENINKYLETGSADFNPYYVKSTMDDLCQKYHVTTMTRDWYNANRENIESEDRGRILSAIDLTDKLNTQADGLRKYVDYCIENDRAINWDDPEADNYIFGSKLTYTDESGNLVTVKPSDLKKLQDTLQYGGDNNKKLLETAAPIKFSLKDLRKHANVELEKKKFPGFDDAYAEVFGGDLDATLSTSSDVDKMRQEALARHREAILTYGTLGDKDIQTTLEGLVDPDDKAAFVARYVDAGYLSQEDAVMINFAITDDYIADHYMDAAWNVSQYNGAKEQVDAAKQALADQGFKFDEGFNPDQGLTEQVGFFLGQYDYENPQEGYTPLKDPMGNDLTGTDEDRVNYLRWVYENKLAPREKAVADSLAEAVVVKENGQAGNFIDMLDAYSAQAKQVPLYAKIRRGQQTMDDYQQYQEESNAVLARIEQERQDSRQFAEQVFGAPAMYSNGMANYSAHVMSFSFERSDQLVGAMNYLLGFGGRDYKPFAAQTAAQISMTMGNKNEAVRAANAAARGIPVEKYTDTVAQLDAAITLKQTSEQCKKQLELIRKMEETVKLYGLNVEKAGAVNGNKNTPWANFEKYKQEIEDLDAYCDAMSIRHKAGLEDKVANYVKDMLHDENFTEFEVEADDQVDGEGSSGGSHFGGRRDNAPAAFSFLASMLSRDAEFRGSYDVEGAIPEWLESRLSSNEKQNLLRNLFAMTDPEIGGFNLYGKVSPDEAAVMLYYMANGETEKAEQFRQLVEKSGGSGEVQQAATETQEYQQFANEHPVWASAFTSLIAPEQTFGLGYALVQKITGQEASPYSDWFKPNAAISTIRGQVTENIREQAGDIFAWLYGPGMSAIDSMVNGGIMSGVFGTPTGFLAGESTNRFLAFLGKVINDVGRATLMGAEAAGTEVWSALMNDPTDLDTALIRGGLTMAVESLTEGFTVENMDSLFSAGNIFERGLKAKAVNMFKGIVSETVGEGAAEFAEQNIDKYYGGDNSEYAQKVDQYIGMGFTQESAEEMANRDFVHDVMLAGLSGAVMNIGMTGAAATVNMVKTEVGRAMYGRDVYDTTRVLGELGAINKNVTDLEAKLADAQAAAEKKPSFGKQRTVGRLQRQLTQAKGERTEFQAKALQVYQRHMANLQGDMQRLRDDADVAESRRIAAEIRVRNATNSELGAVQTETAQTPSVPTLESIDARMEEVETEAANQKVTAAETEARMQAEADESAKKAEDAARAESAKAQEKAQKEFDKKAAEAEAKRKAKEEAAKALRGADKQKVLDRAQTTYNQVMRRAEAKRDTALAAAQESLDAELNSIAQRKQTAYDNAATIRQAAEQEADRAADEVRRGLEEERNNAVNAQQRAAEAERVNAEATAQREAAAQAEADAKAEADRIAEETAQQLAEKAETDRKAAEDRRATRKEAIEKSLAADLEKARKIKETKQRQKAETKARNKAENALNGVEATYKRMMAQADKFLEQGKENAEKVKNDAYTQAENERAEREQAIRSAVAEVMGIAPEDVQTAPTSGDTQETPATPAQVADSAAQAAKVQGRQTDAANGFYTNLEGLQQAITAIANQMSYHNTTGAQQAIADLRGLLAKSNDLVTVFKASVQQMAQESRTEMSAEDRARALAMENVNQKVQSILDFLDAANGTGAAEDTGEAPTDGRVRVNNVDPATLAEEGASGMADVQEETGESLPVRDRIETPEIVPAQDTTQEPETEMPESFEADGAKQDWINSKVAKGAFVPVTVDGTEYRRYSVNDARARFVYVPAGLNINNFGSFEELTGAEGVLVRENGQAKLPGEKKIDAISEAPQGPSVPTGEAPAAVPTEGGEAPAGTPTTGGVPEGAPQENGQAEAPDLMDLVNGFREAASSAVQGIRDMLDFARGNRAMQEAADATAEARANVFDMYGALQDLLDKGMDLYNKYKKAGHNKDEGTQNFAMDQLTKLFEQIQKAWTNFTQSTNMLKVVSAAEGAPPEMLNDEGFRSKNIGPAEMAVVVLNRAGDTGNKGVQFASVQAVLSHGTRNSGDSTNIPRAGAATSELFKAFGAETTLQGLKHSFGEAYINGIDHADMQTAINTLALAGDRGTAVLRELFAGDITGQQALENAVEIASDPAIPSIEQKKVENYQVAMELRRMIADGAMDAVLEGPRQALKDATKQVEEAETELDKKNQDVQNRLKELEDAMEEYDRAMNMEERSPSKGGNANSGKQNALKDAMGIVNAASQNYGNATSVVAEYRQKMANAQAAQNAAQQRYDGVASRTMRDLRAKAAQTVRQANAENEARLKAAEEARSAEAARANAEAEANLLDAADAARATAEQIMANAEAGRAARAGEGTEGTGEGTARTGENTERTGETSRAAGSGEVSAMLNVDGVQARAAGEGGQFDPSTTEGNESNGPVESGTEIMTNWLDKIGMKYETKRKRYRQDMQGVTFGYVNPSTGIVHVWDSTNMETAMHEVAHVLDYKFHLFESADTQRMIDRLSKIPNWRAWLNMYPAEKQASEAIAEAVSLWMVDRADAIEVCGEKFITDLEAMMAKEGWLKPTLEMKEAWKRNREANSVDRAMGSIKLIDKFRSFPEQSKKWKEVIFDHTHPLYRFSEEMRKKNQYSAENDLRILEKLRARRTQNTMNSFINIALTMPGTDEIMTDMNGVAYRSFAEVLGQIKKGDIHAFNTFLALEHAVDRQKTNVDMDKLSDEEQAQVKAAIREVFGKDVDVNAALEKMRKDHPEFEKVADEFRKMYNAIEYNWGVQTGLIDRQAFINMRKRFPHYVPTFRVGESSHNSAAAMTGSTKDIFNPVVGAMENISKMVGNYYNQEVLRAFDRFMMNPSMDKMGIAERVENDSGKDVVTVKLEDGRVHKWAIYDEGIFNALTYVRDSSLSGLIGKFFGAIGMVTRTMAAANTAWAPEFALQNLSADTFSALMTGDSALTPVDYFAHLLKSAWILARNQNKSAAEMDDVVRYYKMYAEMGSRYAYRNKNSVKALHGELYNHEHEGKISRLMDKIRHPLATIENITGFFEDLTRFNEFRMAGVERGKLMTLLLGKNYQKADMTTEAGRLSAAQKAADVTTDFGQSGSSDILTKLSNVIPFFNASAQGLYKTMRLFTKDNSGRRAFMAAKIVINGTILGAAISALRGLTWDDDDKEAYDRMNDYEKAQYYHIKIGDKQFIRFRKSQDALIGMATTFGEMIGSVSTGLEPDPLGTFLAVGRNVIENALLDPSSNIFSPFIDASYNKTWSGSDIEDTTMQGMDVLDRYDPADGAQPLYRFFSALLNLGGAEYSPADVKYLIGQYTGSVGTVGTGLINNLVALATGEYNEGLVSALTDPFIEKMAKKFSIDVVYSNRLYQGYKSSAAYIDSILNANKQGLSPAGLRLGLTDEQRRAALSRAEALDEGELKEYDKVIKNAWKEYYTVLENDKLTPAEREERARKIREEINQYSIKYTALVNQYRTDYGYTSDFLKNAAGLITPWIPEKDKKKKK